MLLLRESSLTQGLVEEGGYHQNCLVKLHADATSEQVAQVEEYLISRGSFITSEELLQTPTAPSQRKCGETCLFPYFY